MPHFRVDDKLHSHPKARQAGLEAMGLWTMSGSYCMDYLTDGFVPDWFVKSWPKGPALARKLVTAGLWHDAEHEGATGWRFHQFNDIGRQDTREQVEAHREAARERKERYKKNQAERRTERATERRSTTRDEHQPEHPPRTNTRTRTNTPTLGETWVGELTQADAHDPAPRPHCAEHDENSDAPCRACGRRREWDEAHAAQTANDEITARRNAKTAAIQARTACTDCDDDGWQLGPDGTVAEPAIKCTHQHAGRPLTGVIVQ